MIYDGTSMDIKGSQINVRICKDTIQYFLFICFQSYHRSCSSNWIRHIQICTFRNQVFCHFMIFVTYCNHQRSQFQGWIWCIHVEVYFRTIEVNIFELTFISRLQEVHRFTVECVITIWTIFKHHIQNFVFAIF